MIESLCALLRPPPRVEQRELLEDHEGTAEEARENLADISRFERRLGRRGVLNRLILPRIRKAARGARGRKVRILDVGCGGAGLLREIADRARAERIPVAIVGLDNDRRNLAIAREWLVRYPEIELIEGEAGRPSFQPRSFDVVLCFFVVHHLSPGAVREALSAMAALARGAVVVSDLVRSRAALRLFELAAPLLTRNRLTLHDGRLSILRAYTPAEMREMLAAAGFPSAALYVSRVFFRMTAVLEPEGCGPAG